MQRDTGVATRGIGYGRGKVCPAAPTINNVWGSSMNTDREEEEPIRPGDESFAPEDDALLRQPGNEAIEDPETETPDGPSNPEERQEEDYL